MRNDARPIGEQFRDIAEHEAPHKPADRGSEPSSPAERNRERNIPFVVNRDPGDEELPPGSSER
jgi:hypothetical protein